MRFRAHIAVALSAALALPLATVTPATVQSPRRTPPQPLQRQRPRSRRSPMEITAERRDTVRDRRRGVEALRSGCVSGLRRHRHRVSRCAVGSGGRSPHGRAPAPVQPAQLPTAVSDELKLLKPARIYVLGGTAVVSSGVQTALSRIAPTTRLAGTIGTPPAGRSSRRLSPLPRTRSLRPAEHSPTLSPTGAAGSRHAPVVLVDGALSALSGATLDQLDQLGVTDVSIAGGPGAVSDGIQSQLASAGYVVTRYGGASRYDTASLINRAYFPAGSSTATFLATGVDFPDALAAAALAGHLGAPLNVTPRPCMHPATSDAIRQVDAASRVVMGGPGPSSQPPPPTTGTMRVPHHASEPLDGWEVSDWTLARDIPPPYSDGRTADVYNPMFPIDSTGLPYYTRRDTGARADHPVVYAQYGIAALTEYQRTDDPKWLAHAARNAERLTQIRVERGTGWWYPYNFPWTYYSRTLKAPWFSAMAQGQSLSLFTRLAEETGDRGGSPPHIALGSPSGSRTRRRRRGRASSSTITSTSRSMPAASLRCSC